MVYKKDLYVLEKLAETKVAESLLSVENIIYIYTTLKMTLKF